MSEIAVWYDPVRFKYYLERGNVVEEVHSITRQYIEDLTAENDKLKEKGERLFDKTLELATENAKLRDLMYERAHRHAIQHMTEDELRIVATNALDENHELRELVRDMWKGCPADVYYCIHHCPSYDKTSESNCKLYDRMKEFGIEGIEVGE